MVHIPLPFSAPGLWLHDSFALNVYLLTVRGIESPDFRTPYIRAFIMGSEEKPKFGWIGGIL
jgi:hypothetical protein